MATRTRTPKPPVNNITVKDLIKNVFLEDKANEEYYIYGISVIEDRAIQGSIDGLKPVVRRALWATYMLGLTSNARPDKSAKIVGETIANYSPHGDTSSYGAIVTSANSPMPLIKGTGNWGTMTDPPAAYRYCLIEGSRVPTSKGLIPIEDIPDWKYRKEKSKALVTSGSTVVLEDLEVNTRGEPETCTTWLNSGKHKVIEIITDLGFSLTCTPNHPFLTPSSNLNHSWTVAGELKVGDMVVISRKPGILESIPPRSRLPEFYPSDKLNRKTCLYPKRMTKALAFVLGFLVAEGSISEGKIYTNNTDKLFFDKFLACWDFCFPGSKYSVSKEKPRSYGKKYFYAFSYSSTEMVEWLTNIGLEAGNSYNRKIPNVIFTSSQEEVGIFLQALFEGDGSIFKRKGTTYEYTISYHSMSKTLFNDLRVLLVSYFGIVTSGNASENYGDRLLIKGRENAIRFHSYIHFFSKRKRQVLDSVISNIEVKEYKDTGGCAMYERLPKIFSDTLKTLRPKLLVNERAWRTVLKPFSSKQTLLVNVNDACKEITANLTLRQTVLNRLLSINTQDYAYAKVVSTKPAGKAFVYDLTVPKTHSFVANGFVVHNTSCCLSKYADLIFFDKFYLPVIDYIPNYDGSRKEPLVLPTLLPNCLLNGNFGITPGVQTRTPSFTLASILKVLRQAIPAGKCTPEMCLDLEFTSKYGGVVQKYNALVPTLLAFYKTGKGKFQFESTEVGPDAKNEIRINRFAPIANIAKTLGAVEEIKGVIGTRDDSDKHDPYQKAYTITLARGLKGNARDDAIDAIMDKFSTSVTFSVQATNRILNSKGDCDAKLFSTTVPNLLQLWIEYRIDLEIRACTYWIEKRKVELEDLHLLRLAVKMRDIIIAALRLKISEVELAEYLAKKLGITVVQANRILDLKIRQLRALEDLKLVQKIKDIEHESAGYAARIKKPRKYILEHLSMLEKALG